MSESLTPGTLGEVFANAVERIAPSIVTVDGREGVPATGVVLRVTEATTSVITASHVVESEDQLVVRDGTGTEFPATLVGRDLNRDLAVLHLETTSIPAATPTEAEPRIGSLVMAIGRPIPGSVQASFGAISYIGSFSHKPGKSCHLIHAETVLYPGFSGGPLIDSTGTIVGVNSSGEFKAGRFAIPIALVQRVLDDIEEIGYVRQPWLGIAVQQVELPPHVRESVGDQHTGLIVLSVEEGSPAQKSGLATGDMLVAVDAVKLIDVPDFQRPLCEGTIGQPISILAWRGETRLDLSITPTARPEQPCCT